MLSSYWFDATEELIFSFLLPEMVIKMIEVRAELSRESAIERIAFQAKKIVLNKF